MSNLINPSGVGVLNTTFTSPQSYTTEIDYVSGASPIYIGKAYPATLTSDAFWLIKKITYDASGNPTVIAWGGGVPTFTQIWDNRSSLSYS